MSTGAAAVCPRIIQPSHLLDRDTFLQPYPQVIHDLVSSIENAAGVPILITAMRLPMIDDVMADNPAAAAITQQAPGQPIRPRIVVYNNATVSTEVLLHELCHLERYVVRGIPQYTVTREAFGLPEGMYVGSSPWLDNKLEHLVIFRRMIQLGHDPSSTLNLDYNIEWRDVVPCIRNAAANGGLRPPALWSVLLQYAITVNYCCLAVRHLAELAIQESRIEKRAHDFERDIRRALHDKRATVRVVSKYFEIPGDVIRLRYHDFGRRVIEDVPLWERRPTHAEC